MNYVHWGRRKRHLTIYYPCVYMYLYVYTHACLWWNTRVQSPKVEDRCHPWSLSTTTALVLHACFMRLLGGSWGSEPGPSCAYSRHFDNWAIFVAWEICSEKCIWLKEMQIYPWEKWTALAFRWWRAHPCLGTVASVPLWDRKLMERRLCVCEFSTESPLFFL